MSAGEGGRGPEFEEAIGSLDEGSQCAGASLTQVAAERTQEGGLFPVFAEVVGEARLHYLEVLDEAHFALITGQGPELTFAEPGEAGSQRLHDVAEALECHASSMNGVRHSQIDGPPSCDGCGKGICGGLQNGGFQPRLPLGAAGVDGEISDQGG